MRNWIMTAAVLGAMGGIGVAQADVRVLTAGGATSAEPMRPATADGAPGPSNVVTPIVNMPSNTSPSEKAVAQTPAAQSAAPAQPATTATQASPANDGLPPLPESKAFGNTLQGAMPLSAGQIAELRAAINANRQAEEAPLSPATPRLATINARLGVGQPPSVSVQQGYVSTLNVVDAYGRAWPIVRYSVGNPKAFTISVSGNSAAISDMQPYAQSDLALYLQGESVPLMVALNPGAAGPRGGGVVDYAVRLRVNAAEPGLPQPVGGMAGGADYTNALMSLVQGVPPPGAKSLKVLGDPARVSAWTWNGPRGPRLLLRAPATVIAPAWIATMQGPAGIHAWVLPNIKIVTLSRHGQPQMIQLQRYQWEANHHG